MTGEAIPSSAQYNVVIDAGGTVVNRTHRDSQQHKEREEILIEEKCNDMIHCKNGL